ncbi:MAG: EpsG family protein [Sphingomonadaceae bacterium]
MYPYLIMLGLPAVLAYLTGRQTQAGIGLLVVFLLFTAVIGLRYEIGPDWWAYLNQLRVMPQQSLGTLAERGELGWAILVQFSDSMGWGIHGLAIASGLVFCIGLFAIARACQEPMLAVVAAVPYLSIAVAMSGMRQAMAIGIVFFLIAKWYRYPVWLKIVLVLVAASFHFSALALLLVVALDSRMQLGRRIVAGAFVFAVVAWQVSTSDIRVDRYTRTYFEDGAAASAEGALYHVLLTAVPCLAYFFMRRRWIELYGRISIIDILAAIGVIALVFVFFFPTATDRMTLYFSAVALIIQGNFPQLWRGRTEQMLVRTGIVVLNAVAMMTFLIAGNKAGSFVPYKSVFSDEYELGVSRR